MSENVNQNSDLKITTYSVDTGSVNSGNVNSLEIEHEVMKNMPKDGQKRRKNFPVGTKEVIALLILIPMFVYISAYISIIFSGFGLLFLVIYGINPFGGFQRKSVLIAVVILVSLLVLYNLLK